MRNEVYRAVVLAVLISMLAGLQPASASTGAPSMIRDMDDAMLLMIASHVRLVESLESEALASAHGQMSIRPVGIKADGKTINEVVGLIELYRKYEDTLEAEKDQYTDH